LKFEQQFGDEKGIEQVKERAVAYVNKLENEKRDVED
jgi:hypothetical protein